MADFPEQPVAPTSVSEETVRATCARRSTPKRWRNRWILAGGPFRQINGTERACLARLNPDGSLDTGFEPQLDGSWVSSLALQADGKMLFAGNYLSAGGAALRGIGRVKADGTLDTTFPGVAYDFAEALLLDAEGNILFVGERLGPDGHTVASSRFVRARNTEPAVQSLSCPGGTFDNSPTFQRWDPVPECDP